MENAKEAPWLPSDRPGFAFPLFFLSIVLLVLASGCAAPGEPYERKPVVPDTIADLAAEQLGNDIVLTFTLPKETFDHRPLEQSPAIEIFRSFEAPLAPGETSAAKAAPLAPTLLVTIPPAMAGRYTENGQIRYVDSLTTEDFFQHPRGQVVYIVRTRASQKRDSASSNVVDLPIYPAPNAIADLQAEVSHSGIDLRWTPSQKAPLGPAPPVSGYHIYRAESAGSNSTTEANAINEAGPAPETAKLRSSFAKIGETESENFEDTQVETGKTYLYTVRGAAQYPEKMIESPDSNRVTVLARDTFPPATPEGLVVVPVPAPGGVGGSLDLSWAISSETDLAGYNVYRSEQDDIAGTRLNTELLRTPAFRDMDVAPGRRYFYRVTAVDRSGNESPASKSVSSALEAESQPKQ